MANEREITLYFLDALKAHYGKNYGPGMAASLRKTIGIEIGIETLERACDIVIATRKANSFPDMPACIAAIKQAGETRRPVVNPAFGESAPRPALVRTAKEIEQQEWQRKNLPWNGLVPIPRFPKRPPMPKPHRDPVSFTPKPPVNPDPQVETGAQKQAAHPNAPSPFHTGPIP
jgi:hypothetical protein